MEAHGIREHWEESDRNLWYRFNLDGGVPLQGY